jgi:hypothetical protein
VKRCPECEFLYENESTHCDMDGTPLRYTVKLPTLPGLAQSIWDKWTIALLCGVIVGTMLVILYSTTPLAFTSSAGETQPPQSQSPAERQTPQVAESAPPSSESSAPEATEPIDTSTDTRDPFDQSTTTSLRAPRSKRSSTLEVEESSAPAPVVHFEPAANSKPVSTSSTAVTEPAPAKTSAISTLPTASATSTIHPKPPAESSNKPNTQDQKKDSGIKSIFKKAGKILKKPFGDN